MKRPKIIINNEKKKIFFSSLVWQIVFSWKTIENNHGINLISVKIEFFLFFFFKTQKRINDCYECENKKKNNKRIGFELLLFVVVDASSSSDVLFSDVDSYCAINSFQRIFYRFHSILK